MDDKFYFNFKETIESNTKDGEVDYGNVNKTFNDQFQKYSEKNNSKITENARTNWESETIKGFGLEDVTTFDGVKELITNNKMNQTELSKKYTELDSTNKGNIAKIKEYEGNVTELNGKLNSANENMSIFKAGVNPKYTDAVMVTAKKLIKDDINLDKAIELVKEDKDYSFYFNQVKQNAGGGIPNSNHRPSNNGDSGKQHSWNRTNRR